MNFNKTFLCAVCIAAFASGCGEPKPEDVSGATAVGAVGPIYASSKGYSIEHPADWTYDRNADGFFSSEEGENDVLRESFNVDVESLEASPEMTLEQFAASKADTLKTKLNAEVLGVTDASLGGLPAKEISYISRQGGMVFKITNYIAIKDKKAYMLACISLEETYPKYKETFERIVSTFQFKK